jgi:hypothetical protein
MDHLTGIFPALKSTEDHSPQGNSPEDAPVDERGPVLNVPHMLKGILRDPLVRRFVTASLFAGAFVWVAVDTFHVETDVVMEFFLLSIAFVAILILAAMVFAFVVHLVRRSLSKGESQAGTESVDGPDVDESGEV